MSSKCNHILAPLCGCPALVADVLKAATARPELTPASREVVVGAVMSAGVNTAAMLDAQPPVPTQPPEETHAGPAPKKRRRNAASPWSPNYQDPVTGEYPNRPPPPKTEDEKVEEYLAKILELGDASALFKEIDITLARAQFSEFCRQAWHVVEPATKLTWGWHHELLCNVLQALFESWHEATQSDGELLTPIKNVVLNCPPGSLKSRVISVFYPVWIWLRAPGTKLICLSVNEAAAQRDARAARDLIKSSWFQESFKPKWQLKGDQDAISNYGNNAGGERLSKPSGSVIVGLRADVLIGDDMNDPEDVKIDNEREKVNATWDDSQYTRVNDPLRSLRITVQQRLHERDHTGHVISRQGLWSPQCGDPNCTAEKAAKNGCCNTEGWLNVVLSAELDDRRFEMPAVLEKALRKKLGDGELVLSDPRTKLGESIDPKRMPSSFLEKERYRWKGTNTYAGQYLQRPSLAEGTSMKRNYWGFFRLEGGVRPDIDEHDTGRPRPVGCEENKPVVIKAKHYAPGYWDFDWVVITIDCALKETKRGSNWGLVAVAGKDGRRFILDDRTQRGDILEIIRILREMILLWRPDKILIEDKAAGDEMKRRLIAAMSAGADMPMVTLEMVKVGSAGKEERLDACLPAIANGLVYLREGAPWLEAFVDECAMFPVGAYDDRVDAVTQCLNHIKDYEEDAWPAL